MGFLNLGLALMHFLHSLACLLMIVEFCLRNMPRQLQNCALRSCALYLCWTNVLKKRILMLEIITARKIWNEYVETFELFKKNLLLERKLQQLKQKNSHAHVIDEANDVGGAPVKSPETAAGEIINLESALNNDKLGSANKEAFLIESFRVLVELMRGVKVKGQQPVEVTYDAMVLGNEWMEAEMDVCVMKVWVGTMVERLSVFEVLKREIAENWKIEEYVRDRILFYQRKIANVGSHSQCDDTITEMISGVGAVLVGDLPKHHVENKRKVLQQCLATRKRNKTPSQKRNKENVG